MSNLAEGGDVSSPSVELSRVGCNLLECADSGAFGGGFCVREDC